MCGIAGIVARASAAQVLDTVRRAAQALHHRGPDDAGDLAYQDAAGSAWTIGLAHRRLSIIDLSAAARQPMGLPDEPLFIVFNGEIYNYRELRAELEALGRRFRTQSDTEVLLAAYAQWGPACLPRLAGMFAFAILDTSARRLFLARDVFGIKPLYYTTGEHGFTFASEIPALLELPGASRQANPRRVFEFLNDGVADHGGDTFFAAIHQLPAAHYLEVSLDCPSRAQPVRYWDLDRGQSLDLSFDAAARRLRDLFAESVALHLRSDVPLGVALSGGIDSSSVLMMARQVLGPRADLHTFSFIAADPAISEETWVDEANRAAGAVAHKFKVGNHDLNEEFDLLIGIQGEPFLNPLVYAQLIAFRKAKELGIKVLLEGQGADELLAGYPQYASVRLASLLGSGRGWDGLRFLQAVSGRLDIKPSGVLRAAVAGLLPPAIREPLRRAIGKPLVFPWLDRSWFLDRGVAAFESPNGGGRYRLRQALHETLFKTKIPTFVRWADRNAMACAVENRVPFLTPALAAFLFSLPEEYLLAGDGTTKAVFRQAMRGLVPDRILERKAKIGFATPYGTWLGAMRPRAQELLRAASEIPALNAAAIHLDCAPFQAGRPLSQYVLHRLWSVLFLTGWARRFGVSF